MADNHFFGISWSESQDVLKQKIPSLAWSSVIENIENFSNKENGQFCVFSIGLQGFEHFLDKELLRPLNQILPIGYQEKFDSTLLKLFNRDELSFGLPDDISPFVIAVPKEEMNKSCCDWDWLRKSIIKHKNKATNEIPFWNGGKLNTMGFLLSVLLANGVPVDQELSDSVEYKDRWLESYEWLKSIEINWQIFFNDTYKLNWLNTLNSRQSIEFGWLKILKKPIEEYRGYEPISFPKGPSYQGENSQLFVGSCWASFKNKVSDAALKPVYKELSEYALIHELEVKSNSYCNMNQKIWSDAEVLSKKPFYEHAKNLLTCDNALFLNIYSEKFKSIENTFRIALVQNYTAEKWFALIEGLLIQKDHGVQNPHLEKATNFIKEQCAEIHEIKEVAEFINRSVTYVKSIFKENVGVSCWEYVLQMRVKKAQDLLAREDMPIKQISYAVGFKNASTFIRAFKKVTGVTPNQYRKQFLK